MAIENFADDFRVLFGHVGFQMFDALTLQAEIFGREFEKANFITENFRREKDGEKLIKRRVCLAVSRRRRCIEQPFCFRCKHIFKVKSKKAKGKSKSWRLELTVRSYLV